MNTREVFENVMLKSDNIALATAVDNQPNVRIISYIFDNNKVYFTSFKGRPKNSEIEANEVVAFTTEPVGEGQCVRVTGGVCKVSETKLQDMREKFVARHPGFEIGFEKAIDMMELYEISFDKAMVTLGFGKNEIIEL